MGKKKAQLKPEDDTSAKGDFWTWVAIDPDSKLVPHHLVAKRDMFSAEDFHPGAGQEGRGPGPDQHGQAGRLPPRLHAAWGKDVDYGRIVKRYAGGLWTAVGTRRPRSWGSRKRSGPGTRTWTRSSTSIVERQHLTMRMGIRRMTRLTNGFSKKVEHFRAAVALHFAYYNLVRRHSTVKTTPAKAAGVVNREWKLPELVEWAEVYGSA